MLQWGDSLMDWEEAVKLYLSKSARYWGEVGHGKHD